MLTRLEVDGFKNLDAFAVDFGAFTCIAGENGVGKSNVFDVIHFLSLIADRSFMEAAQQIRSTADARSGDARDLFGDGHGRPSRPLRLAAEMIVEPVVEDEIGQIGRATTTFLRYEIDIGLEPQERAHAPALVLLRESLTHITQTDAPSHLHFAHAARNWRRALVTGRRSGLAFISTDPEDQVVIVHQDGGSRGKPFRAAALGRSPRSVLSTQQSEQPTIMAARREMQKWRRLALEPTALRSSDSYVDATRLGADGRHLAATLNRIAHHESEDPPEDVYARIASRLNSLAELGIEQLWVEQDDTRELLTVWARDTRGVELPARSLSEGTLRFLALCTLLEDQSASGLFCTEEPENGIHPLNLRAMIRLLTDLAVDPREPPGPDNPTRQVIINTHSPHVVQLIDPEDLLFADAAEVTPFGRKVLRLRPMIGTWRDRLSRPAPEGHKAPPASKGDLLAYLAVPEGSQYRLDLEESA